MQHNAVFKTKSQRDSYDDPPQPKHNQYSSRLWAVQTRLYTGVILFFENTWVFATYCKNIVVRQNSVFSPQGFLIPDRYF